MAPRFTKHGSGGFSDIVTDWKLDVDIRILITIAAQPRSIDWAFPNRPPARPP